MISARLLITVEESDGFGSVSLFIFSRARRLVFLFSSVRQLTSLCSFCSRRIEGKKLEVRGLNVCTWQISSMSLCSDLSPPASVVAMAVWSRISGSVTCLYRITSHVIA